MFQEVCIFVFILIILRIAISAAMLLDTDLAT